MLQSSVPSEPKHMFGSQARRRFRSMAVGAVLAGLTCGAQSAQQWCSGTLSYLFVDTSGAVYVNNSWRGDYVILCNVNGTWAGIPTTTCLAWLSLARNALQRASYVTFYYSDAPACNAMPTYGSAPVPSYIMMNN